MLKHYIKQSEIRTQRSKLWAQNYGTLKNVSSRFREWKLLVTGNHDTSQVRREFEAQLLAYRGQVELINADLERKNEELSRIEEFGPTVAEGSHNEETSRKVKVLEEALASSEASSRQMQSKLQSVQNQFAKLLYEYVGLSWVAVSFSPTKARTFQPPKPAKR
eukprot:GHVN01007121.1.p1 GENE.GHVN01007121.1~~GHVN01007121.1.p1  ORF type:complete len:163 (+),score=15.10 GHVN01007121.1:92-580(+)